MSCLTRTLPSNPDRGIFFRGRMHSYSPNPVRRDVRLVNGQFFIDDVRKPKGSHWRLVIYPETIWSLNPDGTADSSQDLEPLMKPSVWKDTVKFTFNQPELELAQPGTEFRLFWQHDRDLHCAVMGRIV